MYTYIHTIHKSSNHDLLWNFYGCPQVFIRHMSVNLGGADVGVSAWLARADVRAV